MSWQDRVNDSVYLKSPSGLPFRAFWKGNKRTKEKKLGIFQYAKAKGAVVQDLDISEAKYPLNIYFEGNDHDIFAAQFWNACDERGVWEVLHPVRGSLTLQLVSVAEDIQPVESGGITEFELEWLEVGIDNPAASVAQLEDDVYQQLEQLQKEAINQFGDKVKTDKPSLLAKLIAAVMKVVGIVNKIKSTIAGVVAMVTAIRNTVMGVINAAVMLVNSLASAVMSLILLPGQLIKDVSTRFQYFGKILDTTFSDFSKDFKSTYGGSTGGINTAAVVELVATACIAGMVQTLVEADFTSREEALSYLDELNAAFMKVTNGLDAIQASSSGSAINKQYFSQSTSFNDMLELLRRVRELLLRRSFDLAAAKYITLAKDRAPIEIALTEGVDFDVFVDSNKLRSDEILLLPQGRKVVIYL